MRPGRREVLAAAGAAATALLGGGAWLARRGSDLAFEPHPAMPGFRLVAGGRVSGGSGLGDGLIGLGAAPEPGREGRRERVRRVPCAALFGGPTPPGVVPVASFSDYSCPFCRVTTERLAEVEGRSGGGVRVAWHELPLLGASSRTAARAALAAARQGAYPAMHARLMRAGFQITPAYLDAVAGELGLDAERLRADMASPAIEAALGTSAALADAFGFPGTPAMVVGRTVVVGEIGARRLAALIGRERADGPIAACGGSAAPSPA